MDVVLAWMDDPAVPGLCVRSNIGCIVMSGYWIITTLIYTYVIVASCAAHKTLTKSFLLCMVSLFIADVFILWEATVSFLRWKEMLGSFMMPEVVAVLNKLTPLHVAVLAVSRVHSVLNIKNNDPSLTDRFTAIVIGLVWVFSIGLVAVNWVFDLTVLGYNDEGYVAYYIVNPRLLQLYTWLKVGSIIISISCYPISAVLLSKLTKVAPAPQTTEAGGGHSALSSLAARRKNEIKVMMQGILITAGLIIDAICTSLFTTALSSAGEGWIKAGAVWLPVLYFGWICNAALNPFLYIAFSKAIRDHVFWRKKWGEED